MTSFGILHETDSIYISILNILKLEDNRVISKRTEKKVVGILKSWGKEGKK